MKQTLGRGISLLLAVFAMFAVAGCDLFDSDEETITPSGSLAASVVIGQADFTGAFPNRVDGGGPAAANTINAPCGNPLVVDLKLYLPDAENHRVLVFDTIPTGNGVDADNVLGQSNFTHQTSNDNNQDDSADETPTPSTLSSPEGVESDGENLFVLDYGNNRVLIWNSLPDNSFHEVPDNVIGQPGFVTNSSGSTAASLNNPEGLEVAAGKLIVADTGNNRVLIWNDVLSKADGADADIVLGQSNFDNTLANNDDQNDSAEDTPTARTLKRPAGVWSDGAKLIVADRFNNRVLIWNTFPAVSFDNADVVVGQFDNTHNAVNDDDHDGNEDETPSELTLNRPYYVDSDGTRLVVADANNNRVLIWNAIPTTNFASANIVLGQDDFESNAVDTTGANTLSGPRGVRLYDYVDGVATKLLVTDAGNHRFLIYELP